MFWKKKRPQKEPGKVELFISEMQQEDVVEKQSRIMEKFLPGAIEVDLLNYPGFCNRWLFNYARRCIKNFVSLDNPAYWPNKCCEQEFSRRNKKDTLYLHFLFKNHEVLKDFYWGSPVHERCAIVRDALQYHPSAFREEDEKGISLEYLVTHDDSTEPFQAAFNFLMGANDFQNEEVNSAMDRNMARHLIGQWHGPAAEKILAGYLEACCEDITRHSNAAGYDDVLEYCIDRGYCLSCNPLRNIFIDGTYDPLKASKIFYRLFKSRPTDDTIKIIYYWCEAESNTSIILTGLIQRILCEVVGGNLLREFLTSPFYARHNRIKKIKPVPTEIASTIIGYLIAAHVEYSKIVNRATSNSKVVDRSYRQGERRSGDGFTAFHILDSSPFLMHSFAAATALASTFHPVSKEDLITGVFDGFTEYLENEPTGSDELGIESRLFLTYIGFDFKYRWLNLLSYFKISVNRDNSLNDATTQCLNAFSKSENLALYREMIHGFFGWIIENRETIEDLLPNDFKT